MKNKTLETLSELGWKMGNKSGRAIVFTGASEGVDIAFKEVKDGAFNISKLDFFTSIRETEFEHSILTNISEEDLLKQAHELEEKRYQEFH